MTERKTREKLPKLSDLTPRLLKALDTAEALLEHDDPSVKLKAISAVTGIVATYAKLPPAARRDSSEQTDFPFPFGE